MNLLPLLPLKMLTRHNNLQPYDLIWEYLSNLIF
jgi:hypothetical protein